MLRGLEAKQEQTSKRLLRDVRTLGQRISDFFKNPTNVAITLGGVAAAAFLMPGIADIACLIGIGCFLYTYTRKNTLPFRMPLRSGMLDYNDTAPGSNKPNKARGICFFGNEISSNEELWFSNEDMRTHVLIFGSTGSGKTQALISLAYNALIQGSGFIYVDGKGDNSLYASIFSMARSVGREDDVLLINFMTGARDIVGPQERRLSNTLNPFASGSSSMLSQLVISMMDASSGSPDGDMWKGRAIVFIEALMKILVYMRDQGHVLLDANSIRNYFEFSRLEAMVMDKQFIRDNLEPVNIADSPPIVLEPISNYVFNLPGYDKSKKGKQVSQVLEQHGFITMQLTRAFGSLADTYGHIIRTNLPEVDLRDVVLNRRILVVLLPALEKSPDELANLGKIIIASLKAMMASGLGEEVEGRYHELVQRKPTNAPTPFLCILDEYGYYAVPGFAVVPAQARSLGFSTVFAGQDLPAFQKASKEEAASIGANTNIKICMKLEDPTETWDFFNKTAGEAFVAKVDSFQTRPDSVLNNYMDTRSASTEKRARIDLLDLKDQREGEAHIFFKSKIVRARMFYANPKPVERMRLNQFLKVNRPPARTLIELEQRLDRFSRIIEGGDFFVRGLTGSDEVSSIAEILSQNEFLDPIERGVTTLLTFHNQTAKPEKLEEAEELVSTSELNIFTRLRVSDDNRHLLITDDLERFGTALLNRTTLNEQMHYLERVTGKQDTQSENIAAEITKDMQAATHYPPIILESITRDEVVPVVDDLIKHIVAEREKKKAEKEAAGTSTTTTT